VTTHQREPAPHLAAAARPGAPPTINLDEAGDTPILREYRLVKAEHPDAIVLARLGDFYEMFGADAEIAAPIIGVQLTGRGFGSAGRLPMCGVPHRAVTGYLRRLLDAGRSVVLWDQVGEVVAGRLVRREVTRVLSPGTIIDADLLDEQRTARLVALAPVHGRVGLAALDAAGGELWLSEIVGDLAAPALRDELERLDVAELVTPQDIEIPETLAAAATRVSLPAALFDRGRAQERLRDHVGVAGWHGLGAGEMAAALSAAGAVLAFCERSRIALPDGFLRVANRGDGDFMRLDPPTRRNLELVAASGGGPSLAQLLDHTRTPMGARLLRRRVGEPLVEAEAIRRRLDTVASLVAQRDCREALAVRLAGIRDLERLAGRAAQGTSSPRDLGAVRDVCAALPDLGRLLRQAGGELAEQADACVAPPALTQHLTKLLADELPASGRDGGSIREGADAELVNLAAQGASAREYIGSLESRERQRTGVRALKVGYNRIFGYYLEVPNAQRESVPADYVRKQTLVGAERYITGDLKEQETIVLHVRERMVARELELLSGCTQMVADHAGELLAAAAAIAMADVAQSLAGHAHDQGWTRPDIDTSTVIDIDAGRHPLVERSMGRNRFIANETGLDAVQRIVVLTGPNMAGKSTYLRQVALITLLAQVGSFVPAERARIGVCDRIFTRVGAHDDLAGGLSTFMVEMSETAAILRQATERSLVILDEIGRGTSTYDGLSIAQAIVEHIHDAPQLNCRTLFATHYHELTALAEWLPRVSNARVEVADDGETITFLHRIVPGGADRSYGIHVGKLAGLPAGVLQRARQLLHELEAQRPLEAHGSGAAQLDLGIGVGGHAVLEALLEIEVEELTPLAALNKLAELRARAGR